MPNIPEIPEPAAPPTVSPPGPAEYPVPEPGPDVSPGNPPEFPAMPEDLPGIAPPEPRPM